MTAKLAHQVIVCLNVLAAREGMALAEKAGIDLTIVQEVVRAGGAQSRVADSCIKNKPTSTRLWYKDLMPALEFAGELGVSLPATVMAQELIENLLADE
jgi:3-hydroxyisobutyrate dehydrogenase-like beta-hydroxyacid dehydrogenase